MISVVVIIGINRIFGRGGSCDIEMLLRFLDKFQNIPICGNIQMKSSIDIRVYVKFKTVTWKSQVKNLIKFNGARFIEMFAFSRLTETQNRPAMFNVKNLGCGDDEIVETQDGKRLRSRREMLSFRQKLQQ